MASRLSRLLRPLRKGARPPGWGEPLIVVGLGNPGGRYRNTRHNVGWWCVDELARRTRAKFKTTGRHTQIAEVFVGHYAVALVKPLTFVNESGRAVDYLLRRYSTGADRLLVLLDEMDLAPGRIRIRSRGGAGGHNGLRSIIAAIGTEEFARIRIGVGRPDYRGQEIEHVLSSMPPDELAAVREMVTRAADAVERVLVEGVDRTANEFNT
jgi:PTH1 family peptidyl-tRNA hydrolase